MTTRRTQARISPMRRALAIAATTALFAVAHGASAQTFPSRPIKIIPFGTAGGPIDGIARIYGEKLKERWGQPYIVEAKPGASGIIAADAVAKAPPDGYTVFLTLPLTHVNAAILNPKLPYDPVKDFEPLSQLAAGSPMLVAPANAPYSNLKEFVAYAKTKPNLSYGTWGNGSQAHLMGELFKRQNAIAITHVPYKSEAAAHSDMLGSTLDFAWANPATARNQSQAGKMKVLGVGGTRRLSALPNVPTFAEQGFAGYELDSWIGVYAPAKTPKDVVDKWVQALREITQMPDVRDRLIAYGFEPLGNTPAEFAAIVKRDTPVVAELIKAAGVTQE